MVNNDTSWRNNSDWKVRYSQLYSARRLSQPQEQQLSRISFMGNDTNPYSSVLFKLRTENKESLQSSAAGSSQLLNTLLSQQSDIYGSFKGTAPSEDLGGHDTLLLDMVHAHSREMEEAKDQTLDLPRDDVSETQSIDACIHGLSMRMTDRSVSRSRVSRMSTRRDMDIPSILAYNFNNEDLDTQLHRGTPAFQKVEAPRQEIPRWSIRRSVCPVCSQKWRDRSSVKNVKNSGLKRNSSIDLPSVMAPARLRTSITIGYVPRPALAAIDKEAGVVNGGMRNTSATWQLSRARRFRSPKPLVPPPEATMPPSATAPLARKDLDNRVSRFLKDKDVLRKIV